ncbi:MULTISPECIES: DUF6471 domain-containing protein [unclassified Caballeronia]|uniref:DUF6471 domain-containing protein n=1 Tax=unclassified Caballeronia TaxID=2646786 RepID=UPI00202791B0|nr:MULTISPECIES: DUF6471 domain-containing protein [unclassified Caballeronia]MDR5768094.1 DUF6471 domain-containing protein [Caballeronia sp. LZ028]
MTIEIVRRDFVSADEISRSILRVEMAKKNVSVTELSYLLQQIGAFESVRSLSTKIKRGKFSLTFLIQCLAVMDVARAEFDIPTPTDLVEKGLVVTNNRPKAGAMREAELNLKARQAIGQAVEKRLLRAKQKLAKQDLQQPSAEKPKPRGRPKKSSVTSDESV